MLCMYSIQQVQIISKLLICYLDEDYTMNDQHENAPGVFRAAQLVVEQERHFRLAAGIIRTDPRAKRAAAKLVRAFEGVLVEHAQQFAPEMESDQDLPSWRLDEAKDVLLWLVTEFLSGIDFTQQDMDYGRTKAYQLTPAHLADWFDLEREWETPPATA